MLNSTLDPAEQRARLAEIEAGRYDLVYVAPERFRSPRFVETMLRVRPALLAVDEAHCISEWGHDFRPDYARIGVARRQIGSPPCIALTATATDLVRRDIADQLELRDPEQFVTGFDRPNLSYAVVDARRDADKLVALAGVLDRAPGSSIIYASSRNKCEAVGQFLTDHLKRRAVVYHAGLSRDERTEAQDRFMAGEVEVVVATNAFGMGVDKANIRSVIHYNLPGTLEAYYQEAGRAGRDGQNARCVLLYAPGDRFLQEMFIDNEYPPPDAVYHVYDYLRKLDADPIELTHAEIKENGPARHQRVGRRHGAEDPGERRRGRAVSPPRKHGDHPDQRRGRGREPDRPGQPAGAQPAARAPGDRGDRQPAVQRAGLLPARRPRRQARPGANRA